MRWILKTIQPLKISDIFTFPFEHHIAIFSPHKLNKYFIIYYLFFLEEAAEAICLQFVSLYAKTLQMSSLSVLKEKKKNKIKEPSNLIFALKYEQLLALSYARITLNDYSTFKVVSFKQRKNIQMDNFLNEQYTLSLKVPFFCC